MYRTDEVPPAYTTRSYLSYRTDMNGSTSKLFHAGQIDAQVAVTAARDRQCRRQLLNQVGRVLTPSTTVEEVQLSNQTEEDRHHVSEGQKAQTRYKLLTGKDQIDYKQFFRLPENHYGVRWHEKKLSKDRSRLDTRKFFFSQRVVNSLNSLPAEVVNAESVKSLKNAYDRLCHKDMDDRSWSACQSINLRVQVSSLQKIMINHRGTTR